ncbi:MAG: NAD(P)/FAD-dependent oxidoreductase [Solirubrobacterales bacterium]
MERIDLTIVGGGVVGLAVALEAAIRWPEKTIALVERNDRLGQETSSRNSEVIHAGLYYPAGSLRALLCARGNERLYPFCQQHGIGHKKVGKLIVARHTGEMAGLEKVAKLAADNGRQLYWLAGDQVARMEPQVRCEGALLSTETGILDSHGLMRAMEREAKSHGVHLLLKTDLQGIDRQDGIYQLSFASEKIFSAQVVNAAGLHCDAVAEMAGLDADALGYRLLWCKGEYFRLRRRFDIRRLVYPVPESTHLGIHFTMDIEGSQKLGPNAYSVDRLDYGMNESNKTSFHEAVVQYIPGIRLDDLVPDYTGIRPRIAGMKDAERDFIIREESARGLPGLVNLIGIESPGLTSCLAIGEYVCDLLA